MLDLPYTLPMAIIALKAAEELFSAPARVWPAAQVEREFEAEIAAQIEKLTSLIRERRIGGEAQKRDLNASFKALAEEGPDLLERGLAQLAETISHFDSIIEEQRAQALVIQAQANDALARLAKQSVDVTRRARRLINKFFKLGDELHNETVEFYYFLLALRADYDPDARGGTAIESAGDIKKFFSEVDT
jgi:sigma54-dependent transcription regulator